MSAGFEAIDPGALDLAILELARHRHPIFGDELQPVATQFVATRNASGRAMDAEDLADAAESVFGAERVTIAPHLDQAIEVAVGLADEADADGDGGPGGALVLIAGSVITAGEARTLLTRRPS